MKPSDIGPGALEGAIACDEVGLSFGIVDTFRLKSFYQPAFARRGDVLEPVMVTARVALQQHGQEATDEAVAAMSAADTLLARRLGNVLAIRNLAHFGPEDAELGLVLALPQGLSDASAEVSLLLGQADAWDLPADRLCFDLSAAGSTQDVEAAADTALSGDASVALDLDAMSRMGSVLPAQLSPSLVRVPPAWTRGIVDEPGLQRIFRPLVSSLARRQVTVQMEGVSDAAQLRAALAAGAGRFQGDHLAVGGLAGTDYDEEPRRLAELLGARDNIIPLTA